MLRIRSKLLLSMKLEATQHLFTLKMVGKSNTQRKDQSPLCIVGLKNKFLVLLSSFLSNNIKKLRKTNLKRSLSFSTVICLPIQERNLRNWLRRMHTTNILILSNQNQMKKSKCLDHLEINWNTLMRD